MFAIVDLLSCITLAKRPCYGRLTIKLSQIFVLYYVLVQFVSFGMQPATMNAVWATIVANVRARLQQQIEVATNKLITCLMYYILLNPSMGASDNTSDGSTLHWIERTQ